MVKVVIATRNKDKLREIEAVLSGIPIELSSLFDYSSIPPIKEDGNTLLENALKKAKDVQKATGQWCIADDTGLFVDILNGAPGVCSARYAGENSTYEQNRRKLLLTLSDVPIKERTARFVCCVVLVINSNKIEVFEGSVEGYITHREIGTGGFGYDSIFMIQEIGKTFAQLLFDEKNRISHRAIALNKLRLRLEQIIPQYV